MIVLSKNWIGTTIAILFVSIALLSVTILYSLSLPHPAHCAKPGNNEAADYEPDNVLAEQKKQRAERKKRRAKRAERMSRRIGRQDMKLEFVKLDELVQRGKAPAALPRLEQFVRDYPQEEQGWVLLNKAYLDVDTDGQGLRLAVSSMKNAVQLNPTNGVLRRHLAELYARSGKFQQALKCMDDALLCMPLDPFIYKSRARIYSEIKRDKEAVADYERFIQLKPNQLDNQLTMELGALCYQRAGQVDKAIKIYDKLWASNKSLAWPLKKAACYTQLGKSKEAIDVYSLVIKESPNDEIALLERGKLRSKLGQNKEAINDFTAALDSTPTSSIYLERAKVYEKLGKLELARNDRQRASGSNAGW